jgi:glycosyltransferase 2 family protein
MNAETRSVKKSVYGAVAGYLLAAAALFWVFHDVNFGVLKREVAHVNWLLACAGVAVDMGRYVAQSIRWSLLIRPVGRISLARTFQSLYAGIFINLLLPLRIGEFVRAYLASRFSSASFPSIMSTIISEYLIDGVWLASGIGAIALVVPLPPQVANPARILGIVVLAAVAAFVFFVARPHHENASVAGGGAPAEKRRAKSLRMAFSFVATMRGGIRLIGRSRAFWVAFVVSSLDIAFHVVAFWMILLAYGINLPLITATAILLFVFVGLIIPNAPSNVGSFQFLCVLGLLAFGVDKTTASGFSVLFFILVNIPQVVIGWIMFSYSGQRLYDIRRKFASLRLSMKEQP